MPCSNNNAPYSLRQIYQKYLLPYEEQMSKKAREHEEEVERRRAAEHKEALEAAEILEAMLGMSAPAYGSEDAERDPQGARKRKRGKVRPAAVPGQLLCLLPAPLAVTLTPLLLLLLQAQQPATSPEPGSDYQGSEGPSCRVPSNIDTMVCELCQGGHHEDEIILCDKCDKGFHMSCLTPPMEHVPDGDWVCPLCTRHTVDLYAFKPGPEMSWGEFERHAAAFKRNYWGKDAKTRKVGGCTAQALQTTAAAAGRVAQHAYHTRSALRLGTGVAQAMPSWLTAVQQQMQRC